MGIWVLGSINLDHVYRVHELPRAGETIAAHDYSCGLGGKGANQSIAAARAGAKVHHVGAVGPDGDAAIAALSQAGVDVAGIDRQAGPTGHAIINVDHSGENAIVILAGANACLDAGRITQALAAAAPGDTLMLQNETNAVEEAASIGRAKGLRVAYSAAPFDAGAVRAMLPLCDILLCNEGEAEEIRQMLGCSVEEIPVPMLVVTRGARGVGLYVQGQETVEQPAFKVDPVDTTGAGDTFAGYFIAGLDGGPDGGPEGGLNPREALARAAAASAIQVTRAGAAIAIPALAEVLEFQKAR